jgi:PAS domain S-box-containing protein
MNIKQSELTFQVMVESTPSAIVLVNKEGKIAYVNNQTEKLFGYNRSELVGQLMEILIPDRYHSHHPGFRKMFFDSPSVRSMGAGRELFALKKDKSEIPVEIGLNPVITADGTLVLASIIDITERKRAEERFRLVVESAPNAMILVNEKGVISLVNRQTELLFGYARKELIGQRMEKLMPGRFRESHPGHRGKYSDKPSARSMGAGRDLYALKKNGDEIQVEIGLNPIGTDEGQMVLASIIDITERKKQEAIIKKQVKELEIKNKELEQFAYIASHDLQEPLRTVSNYVSILKEDYEESMEVEALKYVSTIEKATDRMKVLVKALLDFSRLGKDRVAVTSDCQELMQEVIQDLDGIIESSKTIIKVEELPTIHLFQTELRQLFQNLITNAIKFKKEDEDCQINISCENNGSGKYTFCVADNGIGIDEKYHEKVFYIFQRLNDSKSFEGYGIGLANCKKIVELHGGKIWIKSEVNKGAKFYFTIFEALKA